MDGDLIKSIAIGMAAGLSSAALLPMLFKGKLRFEREYNELRTSYDKRILEMITAHDERIRVKNERHIEVVKLKDEEIERLQDGLQETQRELRDQIGANAEVVKQVFSAVEFLKSLGGLAAKDRRTSGRS